MIPIASAITIMPRIWVFFIGIGNEIGWERWEEKAQETLTIVSYPATFASFSFARV
ncbi:hypothetical protein GCM10027299_46060 [Larkinella ripae]